MWGVTKRGNYHHSFWYEIAGTDLLPPGRRDEPSAPTRGVRRAYLKQQLQDKHRTRHVKINAERDLPEFVNWKWPVTALANQGFVKTRWKRNKLAKGKKKIQAKRICRLWLYLNDERKNSRDTRDERVLYVANTVQLQNIILKFPINSGQTK